MDAAVQLWLDSAHDQFRAPVDAVLNEAADRIGAWLVVESTIIPNTAHPPSPGSRTGGWSQFVFLRQPAQLSYDQWRHNWQVLHTPIAVETQANFEYRQNLVVRALVEGAEPYVAIVEECFPVAAMTSQEAFFDAVGDQARLEANTSAMMESCARFIDFAAGVDVIPTSQHQLRWPD